MAENKSFYNFQFALLCFSSFLFYASFNMLIPELPAHLEALGGEKYIGLIIALFTLTAGISRPFSGKLADTVGRIPVMIFGAAVCFFCGFLYPLANTVFFFLMLRFFHGFSTGFKPTGTSAYVADVVSDSRRGEAMGFLGLCSSLGMASGPALGSTLTIAYSLDVMFYTSSALAIMSVLILSGMKETLAVSSRRPFSFSLLRLSRHEVFDPGVMAPCITLLLTIFSFGTVLTVVPDLSDALLIENRGLFFTCFTVASLAVRFFAGKASDRFGRVIVLKIAALLLVMSMGLLMFVESQPMFIVAAIVFGLSFGMNTPTIFAWTIDLSHQKHRGRGLATMYIALEAGIGLGALFSGWIYSSDPAKLFYVFLLGALLGTAAMIYLQWGIKQQSVAKA